MRKAGLVGLDSKEVSVVGIVEVIEKLPAILNTFNRLKKRLSEGKFDAVVLIDFPDFNLKFAKEAKKLGIPVIYYISPQVWAWRKGRIKTIARVVDKMLVVFPFEEELYRNIGLDVEYVGHPLTDTAVCALTKKEARKKLGVPENGVAIALLPGSRTGEIKRLLKPMLRAAEIIKDKVSKPVFLLPAANSIDNSLLEGFLKDCKADVKVFRNEMYTVLRAADASLITSGTATLETALIGTPMVIIYKMAPVSYAIGKTLIKLKDVGLPNIVAGRTIVPELLQGRATPENMAAEVLSILNEKNRLSSIIKGYEEIKGRLGRNGAASRAAEAINKVINRNTV